MVYLERMERIESVGAIIDKLGGTGAVAALVGISAQGVSNWRSKKGIPPEYFLVLRAALEAKGLVAETALFGFQGASDSDSAASEPIINQHDKPVEGEAA